MMDEQQDILKKSDAELEAYVDTAPAGNLFRQFALEELSRRRLRSIEKGHWSLTPTFWVIVATLIFAIIAAWPVIREWFPSGPPVRTGSNSPPPLSPLESSPAPASKTPETSPVPYQPPSEKPR